MLKSPEKPCHYTNKYASAAQWGWPVGMGHERSASQFSSGSHETWTDRTHSLSVAPCLFLSLTHTHTHKYTHTRLWPYCKASLSSCYTLARLSSPLYIITGTHPISLCLNLLFVHPFLSSTFSLREPASLDIAVRHRYVWVSSVFLSNFMSDSSFPFLNFVTWTGSVTNVSVNCSGENVWELVGKKILDIFFIVVLFFLLSLLKYCLNRS